MGHSIPANWQTTNVLYMVLSAKATLEECHVVFCNPYKRSHVLLRIHLLTSSFQYLRTRPFQEEYDIVQNALL